MTALAAPLIVLTLFATVLAGLPWLASRVRRRGVGSEVLGPFEEMWHPAAVRTRVEVQAQEERPAPTPNPGDPPLLPWEL
ncbi:hypothetical protein [Actinokineospora bangkokensis]|uniref:Uncharacterized protein n=1 Tax=Actinokineospora bangkokensis TaxID=1193682 RepID=A0A1Q9LQQ3_9PSEU|nr:hypothetical protein [Actinokineospora bangkokensis]OLR94377.1 hypothetical protein BJP25_11470 [Actinokineospora bangkokensis]